MSHATRLLLLGLFLAAAAACAATEEGAPWRDFELYAEGQELENVTVEPEFGPDIDLSADRRRVGVRLAFGPVAVRGFGHLFREAWEFTDLPGGGDGAEYDNWGIGGGVKGAPVVGRIRDEVAMLVPYRAELSLVRGDNADDSEWDMQYVDFHADVGFGIDWKGLRPSVGIALSGISGEIDGYGTTSDLSGGNGGVFLDLSYRSPEFPLYGHVRAQAGDYRLVMLGIGVEF